MTTQEVARRAGVGATAVKRWTDAGLLACVRTAGGHRRFARGEVERFLRANRRRRRGRRQRARAVGGRAARGEAIRARSRRCSSPSAPAPARGTGSPGPPARRSPRSDGCWRSGAVTILEEHQASERLARALARDCDGIPLDPGAPRALLACADGDDHTLGLSLTELVLREAGWDALWAGRRTPFAELGPALARSRARLLAVSASEASSDPLALRRQAEALGRTARAARRLAGAGRRRRVAGSARGPGRGSGTCETFHRWAIAERERLGH